MESEKQLSFFEFDDNSESEENENLDCKKIDSKETESINYENRFSETLIPKSIKVESINDENRISEVTHQESSKVESQEVENRNDIFLFEVGERVQVVIPSSTSEVTDPESFYYLHDFTNKRGVILEVNNVKRLQYKVEVGNRTAIVYHSELLLGWPR